MSLVQLNYSGLTLTNQIFMAIYTGYIMEFDGFNKSLTT